MRADAGDGGAREVSASVARGIDGEQQKFDSHYANRVLLVFVGLGIAVLYVETMLIPALPSIAKQFNVTSAQASLILSLYLVSGTALNPVIGKMGDLYGKKRMLTIIMPIYAIMVAVTGFSPNYEFLLASRTVQGVGEGIFPLAFSIVREEFPSEMIPRAQGIVSAAFGIGATVGIPLGAFISNYFGWRTTYHTAVPLVVLLTVLSFVVIKESRIRNPGVKLDYVGASLLGLALAMLVLALSEGSNWGWTSSPVLVLVGAGVLLILALPVLERRAEGPILDLKLLSQRNVIVANLIMLLSMFGLFVAFQSIVYQLQLPPPTGFSFDILTTGLYTFPATIMLIVFALPTGILVSKFGAKPFVMLGSIIGVSGFLLLSTASNPAQVTEYCVLLGASVGILLAAGQNLLVLAVDLNVMGLATSMNTVFRSMGSSLGAPIAGSLISTYTVWAFEGYYRNTPMFFSEASRLAFQYSYYIAAACFVGIFIVTLFAHEVLGKKAVATIANST